VEGWKGWFTDVDRSVGPFILYMPPLPPKVLMGSLPSVLREATVNLGDLDCSLAGEPYFALGVLLASSGATMMVLKPLERPAAKEANSLGRVKITITHNRDEARRRLLLKRRNRAETERKLIITAAGRMTFQEVRDDLTAFGLDAEEMFDRADMNATLVDLMLSDATREALGLDTSHRPSEADADRDSQAQMVTIKDSVSKGLHERPRHKI